MGQKVHPKGLRLGIIKDWDARWFADKKQFVKLLHEDIAIRRHIKTKYFNAGISRIEIERLQNRIKVVVHAAKPGMLIGRGGTGVDELRRDLEGIAQSKQISVNVVEVKNPDLDAQLVAESVAGALERRVSFRRAMKQAISRGMRAGAKGMKIRVSGRLGGAEMSRSEWDWEGSIPLHTLRADIDYGFAEASTTYGKIGVKVWVYKGEVLPVKTDKPPQAARRGPGEGGGPDAHAQAG